MKIQKRISPVVRTKNIRISVLVLIVLVMVLCILFPPRKWVDPEYASSTPRRGCIWQKELMAEMWVSPHLHIDLEVKKDFAQLVIELFLILVSGLFFLFVLGRLSQPDEKGVLFFSFTRNRYLLSAIFVLAVSLYEFLYGPQWLTVSSILAPIVLGALVAFCWLGKSFTVKLFSLILITMLQRILWIVFVSFTDFAIQMHDTTRLVAIALVAGFQLLFALPLLFVFHLFSLKGLPQHVED